MNEKYEPSKIEKLFYDIWEERNYFEIDGNKSIQEKDKYFSLMMPPPNVTGNLHMGHALTFTLQDIITRYKRMDGFKTLWQPGIDHAGIATQNIVEKQLLQEGTTKEELGREKFLKRTWEWKEFSGSNIFHQMKKLGISPAWSRSRFTLDDGLKESVKKAFVELYNQGLITQNNYMVNWCTHDGALSDIEVEHQEIKGKLYHMTYKFANKDGYIQVATTRPETYFGDTAIMVHPDDERYKDIIGQDVILPLSNRVIKIIADEYVDMGFGTGIVKVTPAHDQNDYEIGQRHNLDFIKVFDEKGILNEYAGEFQGQERLKARDAIVKKLQELGHIVKIEEHTHQIGHCYRCKNIVEPFISTQWFVDKSIAKSSIDKTYKGLTKFFPAHWINSYKAWMNDLRPWCISRQLWWGHRIPVFTCNSCNNEWADQNDIPDACPKCAKKDYTQDPDVLDTWFSSALWSFSPLGWGNNNKLEDKYNDTDLSEFYPNSLLITGFDIIFFWVARMMMMGDYFKKELPFKHIYMHALVRDETGAKMSKSKGNVIDPLIMVEEFSADIVRFSLAYLAVQGRDIKLAKNHLELYRNFTNKFYNAANYLQLNVKFFPDLKDIEVKTPLGLHILSKLANAIADIRKTLDVYKFNESALHLYKFVWNEFCDWGIEYSKASKDSIVELGAIFKETLKLTSPFMPFISEYLYHKLSNTSLEESNSIMIMNYPKINNYVKNYPKIDAMFELIEESIVSIRRAKVLLNKANAKIDQAYVKMDTAIDEDIARPFIQQLAKVKNIVFVQNKIENCITEVSSNLEVYIQKDEMNMNDIIAKLEKQKDKTQKEYDKLYALLANKNFVKNAPKNVIKTNEVSLKEINKKLDKINTELESLKD